VDLSGSELTIYAAELNTVLHRHLWPRGLVQPPLTEADQRSMALQATQNQRRPEQEVAVDYNEPAMSQHEWLASGGGEGAGDRAMVTRRRPSTRRHPPRRPAPRCPVPDVQLPDAQLPDVQHPDVQHPDLTPGRLRARRSCSGIDGMDHQERFEELADKFAGRPASCRQTTAVPGGSDRQPSRSSIFAMLSGAGGFIVKLPEARVQSLVAEGQGVQWDANKGKPMREWIQISSTDPDVWLGLADEAFAYVGSLKR